MNFKYLIVEHEGLLVPVLFSTLFRHDDIKNRLALPVVGAGHVKLWENDGEPYVELCGRSGTLNLDPVPEHADIIREDYCRLRGKASLFMEPLAK